MLFSTHESLHLCGSCSISDLLISPQGNVLCSVVSLDLNGRSCEEGAQTSKQLCVTD